MDRFLPLALLLLGLSNVLAALDVSLIGYEPQDIDCPQKAWSLFSTWLAKYSRPYNNDNSIGEKLRRFAIFRDNLRRIDEHNRQNSSSYWLGLNKFADLTHEEFRAIYLRSKGGKFQTLQTRRSIFPRPNANSRQIPQSIDWREKGAVTPVKDQGRCGSCWAFSTVAAVEGVNQIATGQLISLSEQELVDCDTERNQGCNGGLMSWAFEFIIQNGGLDRESNYPYTAKNGTCDIAQMDRHDVTIDSYVNVSQNDELALLLAVAQQPVSVVIDASGPDFQFYAGGVFNGDCAIDLDHAVTAVGYGTYDGQDYWIIKNSWGSDWGDGGYILMQRGEVRPEGICGVYMMPSFPVKLGQVTTRWEASKPDSLDRSLAFGRKLIK